MAAPDGRKRSKKAAKSEGEEAQARVDPELSLSDRLKLRLNTGADQKDAINMVASAGGGVGSVAGSSHRRSREDRDRGAEGEEEEEKRPVAVYSDSDHGVFEDPPPTRMSSAGGRDKPRRGGKKKGKERRPVAINSGSDHEAFADLPSRTSSGGGRHRASAAAAVGHVLSHITIWFDSSTTDSLGD